MKVIDLLNKIANKEDVPKKIKYDNHIFEYKKGINRNLEYICIDATDKIWKELNIDDAIDEIYKIPLILNDEIEIIEDNEIKKLNEHIFVDDHSLVLKINEIIDRLNGEDNE